MRVYLLLMKISCHVFAFLFCLFSSFSGSSQGDFSLHGSVRIKNYTQKEYKANAQIFGISASSQGILHFSNQRGVLQYDGEEWRTLVLDNKMESFSTLSYGEDILVCNTSGLGIFRKQDNGTFVFEDLSSNYTDKKNPISSILKFQDGYVASYLNVLYILDENFQKVTEYKDPESGIGAVTVIDSVVYFRGKKNELVKYNGSSFEKVDKTGFFENISTVSIFKFKNSILLLTENKGLFKMENMGFSQVYYNEDYSFKTGISIKDELISLGSYVNGILILDDQFKPRYKVNIAKGLNDGTIMCQYLDMEQNLWLGTSNGISKVDLLSPVMKYENLFNEATIEDINSFNDNIILASGGGAHEINRNGEVKKIKGINDECFGLKNLIFEGDTSLFISSLYNVFEYSNDKASVVTEGGPYNVVQSPLNPAHLLVLHYDGIQLLEYKEGKFREVKYIKGFCDGEPFNFIVEKDGTIWIGTKPNDGIYRMNVDVFFKNELTFERFYTSKGLPEGQTFLFYYNDIIYAGTDIGIYKFNGEVFQLTGEFGIDFSNGNKGVHRINADNSGNVWMVVFQDESNAYEIGYSEKLEDGTMKWHPEYFYSYDEYIIHSLYHLNDNITWLGGPGGLMSFDKSLIKEKNQPFDALLRLIKVGDSIIYGGNGTFLQGIVFDYDPKKLFEFKFSSNSYYAEEKTVYSYMLEGYDMEWSIWSDKTTRDYSLTEGNYTFKVKAKNILGEESSVVSYSFEVLPPWYRTWWAYTIFFIVFIGVIILIVRLSLRRVKLQNAKLEKIVEERTEEVVAQKAEAEKQRDFAEEQKHLVEEKNLEITDSINYAKRLQTAILTPIKNIQETFENSFILYLPKDIVAGDFYWTNLAKQNNRASRSLIAAADCTGHGVPGAMVSVVCSNALDRSVKEFGLIEPAKILDKVTDLVIETFEQSEDEVKDGMDIAICSYETKGDIIEVQYAGANNPLWVFRSQPEMIVNGVATEPILSNEDNSLFMFEVKATKQPVGKYAERKPFENNVIQLVDGDTLYTFTDGFADQFGGEKGKKFMAANFKKLLLSVQSETMEKQHDIIFQAFNDWKANEEQIDDVCVIGLKL